MPRACQICNNSQRLAIDREIVQGKSKTLIAREFGVSTDSVGHHAERHLSRQLVAAYGRKSEDWAADLLDHLRDIVFKAAAIFDRSYAKNTSTGDAVALNALREQRGTFELLAKVVAFSQNNAQYNVDMEMQLDLSKLSAEEIAQLEHSLAKAGAGREVLDLLPPLDDIPQPDFSAALEWTPAPPRPGIPPTTVSTPPYAAEQPDPAPTPGLEEPRPKSALPPQHFAEMGEGSREEQRRFVNELRKGGVRRL